MYCDNSTYRNTYKTRFCHRLHCLNSMDDNSNLFFQNRIVSEERGGGFQTIAYTQLAIEVNLKSD